MKNWPFSIFFEKPAFCQSLVNFCCSGSSAIFCSYSRYKFPCASASNREIGLAVGNYVGITIDSKFKFAAVFPYLVSLWLIIRTNPLLLRTLSWMTEIIVRRITSRVSSLPLKWMDFSPFPSLFNSPLSNALVARNVGCLVLAKSSIMPSAVFSHSPWGLLTWVPYHFFSDPSPRNDQCLRVNLRANLQHEKNWQRNLLCFLIFPNPCHYTMAWRWSFLWVAQVHTLVQS